jgi:phosphonate degradation associated HDIG domain protein
VNTPEQVVDEVIALLTRSGGEQYFGESVTKLAHAEQCAWWAAQAGADEELVLAALLHDIGHLLDTADTMRDERFGVVNHDETGANWLAECGFSPRLTALVGGHVDAKRYLTATNEEYWSRLSPASRETLRLQGGPMTASDAHQFASDPDLRDKLRLRSWDEAAKDPLWTGPGVDSYRALLLRHLTDRQPVDAQSQP